MSGTRNPLLAASRPPLSSTSSSPSPLASASQSPCGKHFHLPLTEVVKWSSGGTMVNLRGEWAENLLLPRLFVHQRHHQRQSRCIQNAWIAAETRRRNFTFKTHNNSGGYPYIYGAGAARKRQLVSIIVWQLYWICMPRFHPLAIRKLMLISVSVALLVICRQHFCRLIGLWTDLFVALW